jgi:hypothetical protein
METKYISPQELRSWWPLVKPGLEKVKVKSPENWIVEDVYVDCFNGKSMLWALIDDNKIIGYWVLQPNGQELHVWASWSLENRHDIAKIGLKCIKDIASKGNAKYITFSSHRRGWEKRAKTLGFRPRLWICEV